MVSYVGAAIPSKNRALIATRTPKCSTPSASTARHWWTSSWSGSSINTTWWPGRAAARRFRGSRERRVEVVRRPRRSGRRIRAAPSTSVGGREGRERLLRVAERDVDAARVEGRVEEARDVRRVPVDPEGRRPAHGPAGTCMSHKSVEWPALKPTSQTSTVLEAARSRQEWPRRFRIAGA